MKKTLFLFIILQSAIYLQAQTKLVNAGASNSSSPPTNKVNKNTDGSGRKESNLTVPPVDKKNPVRIPLFDKPPIIDGKLEDDVWTQAAVFKDFYQTNPGDNIAPSKPTIAYLGYDKRNLYVAFRCFDEPDKVRATIAKRDDVFGEDNVSLYLDTYDDRRRAYVFAFNPFGVQQDGVFTEGQGTDFSVDVVMESKGMVLGDGWAVEVKIPFKSLRYKAGKGKMWGIHISRHINRFNDEADSWMPIDRNNSGYLAQAGKITGLEEIKIERTLEIVPTITFSETGNRKRTIPVSALNAASIDPGRFVNERIKGDPGLNLKFNFTPNVTLDAAINPDFAEIEADAPVITANQRFPIFFEEKRPFFLEGVEIFQAPLQSFYSRTIVDPDVAAKLTGKIGKTSFGFLAASDNAPGNYSEEERNDPQIRASIGEFLDKNAYFGVARLKRDFGKENNFGFFATTRVFPKNRNFTSGFDGRIKFNPKTVSQFQILGTHSRKFFYNPETDTAPYRTGNGIGYYWNLNYAAKNRGFFLETVGRTRDYRADAGFTRRTNTNSVFGSTVLSTEPKPKAALVRLDWRVFSRFSYDWQGRSQDSFLGTFFGFTLQHNTFFNVAGGVTYERLFEEEFGAKRSMMRSGAFFGASERSSYQPYITSFFRTAPSQRISLYLSVARYWNAFDFDFGAGNRFPRVSPAFIAYQNSPEYRAYLLRRQTNPNDPNDFPPSTPPIDPGTGDQFNIDAGFEYKPVNALRLSLDYTKSKLTRNDTDRTAFNTNIFTLRSTYQFTRFTFVRVRLDYDSLVSNARGQLLFGWNPNPGTAFYIGYNDNFNYNGFSPFTTQLEPRFERNNRTFFIRASYLFRKSF